MEQEVGKKLELSISPIRTQKKPQKRDYPKIHRSFKAVSITPKELVKSLVQGQAFAVGVFDQNIKKTTHFMFTEMIALDFDNNEDPDTIINLLLEKDFHVNIYYPTFSSKETDKRFRLIIFLDQKITSTFIFKKVTTALMSLTKCDRAVTNIAQPWQGSTTATLLSDKVTEMQKIIPWVDSLNLNISSRTLAKIRVTCKQFFPSEKKLKLSGIQKFNYENCISNSSLIQGFAEGTRHLSYAQLRNLISNLMHVKGGLNWIREKMILGNSSNQNDFDLLVSLPKYNYFPEGINMFEPDLASRYKNILALQYISNLPFPKRPNDEINLVSTQLVDLFDASNNNLRVINCQTGIGKTEIMIKTALKKEGQFIIAGLTYDFLDEILMRFNNLSVVALPRPFKLPYFRDEFEQLVKIYGSEMAFKRTIQNAKEKQSCPMQKANFNVLKEYSSNLTVFKKFHKKVSLITHQMCYSELHQNNPQFSKIKTLFIDEDFFHLVFSISSLSYKNWSCFVDEIHKEKFWNKIQDQVIEYEITIYIDYLNGLLFNQIVENNTPYIKDFKKFKEYVQRQKYGFLVLELLDCAFIVRESTGFLGIHKPLDEKQFGQNTIMLSATADPFFYKNLYPNITYNQLPLVENKVKVIQYTNCMFSKNQMKRANCFLPEVGNSKVITYKEMKHLFPTKNQCELHFGNLEGRDLLKGQDITIIGTPVPPPVVTELYAALLGIKATLSNRIKKLRLVELDGFKFKMYTYVDEGLTQIEIRLARAQIEQAIGRARTIRSDAKVKVYSNIPCKQSDIFITQTQKKKPKQGILKR